MNFFVNLLTPVLLLCVLNVFIYRNMPRLNTFKSPRTFVNMAANGQLPPSSPLPVPQPPPPTPRPAAAASGSEERIGLAEEPKSTLFLQQQQQPTAAVVAAAAAAEREENFRKQQREQERDTRYTRASILMVIVFLVCHVPRFATNVVELMLFHSSDTPETRPEVRASCESMSITDQREARRQHVHKYSHSLCVCPGETKLTTSNF